LEHTEEHQYMGLVKATYMYFYSVIIMQVYSVAVNTICFPCWDEKSSF